MFSSDEKAVLKALAAYIGTIRALDDGRYQTVVIPIPLAQKLLNFHDTHSHDPVIAEPDERGTDPKGSSIPPPPEVERAMRTLGRLWEPKAVSCAYCHTHMVIQDPTRDLDAFISIHEKCGDVDRALEVEAQRSLDRIDAIKKGDS